MEKHTNISELSMDIKSVLCANLYCLNMSQSKFAPCLGSKVPCSTAQRMRTGHLEESGNLRTGTVDSESGKKVPSWQKNASRNAWNLIYRTQLGWKVPLQEYIYTAPNGDVVTLPFVAPQDLLAFLVEKHPDVLVCGVSDSKEISQHLEAFWSGYKLQHEDHLVFQEHANSLSCTLPLLYHGDEGRGKKRGNTVVVSCESPLGIHTTWNSRKRRRDECHCKPPATLEQKFASTTKKIPGHLRSKLMAQQTNMRGHSFLQHFILFLLPSSLHKTYPGLLPEMLRHISGCFRMLFYEGIMVNGKNWCFAVCGAKGDLKWFTKTALLDRSFERQARVRNAMCCHECLGGSDQMPWEDFRETPAWAPTRYAQRPWSVAPPLAVIPYIPHAPERQIKRDCFHLCKVGNFRDHAGSCICYMVHANLFGVAGDFDSKLESAYGAFQLYCRATGTSASLRSFTRAFLNYPRFDAFPWVNSKGSDTMILLRWLVVQCAGFETDPQSGADPTYMRIMKETSKAALACFDLMNSHGMFLHKTCAMTLYAEWTRYINGFSALANKCLNDQYNLWGIKPKQHLIKHEALDAYDDLLGGAEFLLNPNFNNCEMNEDFIGRVCRLSRRFDSRHICKRVIQSTLLKASLLYRRSKRLRLI